MSVATDLIEIVQDVAAGGLTGLGIVGDVAEHKGAATVRIGPLLISDVAVTGMAAGAHRWSWWVRDTAHETDGDLSVLVDEWDADSADVAVTVALWDADHRVARTALRREVTAEGLSAADEIREELREGIRAGIAILERVAARWEEIAAEQDELAEARQQMVQSGRLLTGNTPWDEDVGADGRDAARGFGFRSPRLRELAKRWGQGGPGRADV